VFQVSLAPIRSLLINLWSFSWRVEIILGKQAINLPCD
jgi:hypothetical protein